MSDENDRPTLPIDDATVSFSDNMYVTLPTTIDPESFTENVSGTDDEVGQETHRYIKKKVLGKGGNGVVISAVDKKMQRPVALKIAHSSPVDTEEKLRFLREARVTGQLNHPNVMPVYDIGKDANGRLFFTMKEVSGRSLSERIKDDSAGSLLQRLLIFRQVCNAIAFAHSRGVLHRDIKPANIMLGEFGEVLVVDWGLCKVLGKAIESSDNSRDPISIDSLETRLGEVAGTPAYMAPEQARGEAQSLDSRTDIYALGALLYTLVTLKPPFKGSIKDVLLRVSLGQFSPAIDVAPQHVSKELNAIIDQAMHLDQDQRYQTVTDLSSDIQAFIEQRPVKAFKYSWIQRISKWMSRNKRVLRPVAFTLSLSAAALMSGLLAHLNQMETSRDAAVMEAQRANQAERSATIEAINGRASLATSEALYGHSGSALKQLNEVRKAMVELNSDTLIADIGFAIAHRSSVQPVHVPDLDEEPVQVSFSPTGDRLAVLTHTAVLVFGTHKQQLISRLPLSKSDSRILGPWSQSHPWIIEHSATQILATLTTTNEQRAFNLDANACDHLKLTFLNNWLTMTCPGEGMRVWAWDHPSQARQFSSTDAKINPLQISVDGQRVYVDRFTSSLAEHHRKFSVLEKGASIWDGDRGTLNSLSPDGQWILNSTTTGFNLSRIGTQESYALKSKMSTKVFWRSDSTGFSILDTTGGLTDFTINQGQMWVAGRKRLSIDSTIAGQVVMDPSQRFLATLLPTGANLFVLDQPDQSIANLALFADQASAVSADISGDGHLIAIGTEAGRIAVLDSVTGWLLREMTSGPEPVRGLSFHPDGSRLITAHWDGRARIWNLENGEIIQEFQAVESAGRGRPPKTTEVLYLDADRVLITGGDGHVGIWSTQTGKQIMDFSGIVPYAWDSAFSASSNRLLLSNRLGGEGGHIAAILDLNTQSMVALIPGKTEGYGVTVSPSGDRFVITGNSPHALVVDVDGNILQKLPIATPPGYAAGWSPDGRLLAVADFSGRYQLWTTDDWEMVANFAHQSMATALLFAPKGRTLNVVTGSGEIHPLDLNGPVAGVPVGPAWLVALRERLAQGDSASEDSLEYLTDVFEPDDTSLSKIWSASLHSRRSRP